MFIELLFLYLHNIGYGSAVQKSESKSIFLLTLLPPFTIFA